MANDAHHENFVSASTDITEAIRNADKDPVDVVGTATTKALRRALGETKPVFNTHSEALRSMLFVQRAANKEKLADVQAKIDELEAEKLDLLRTDSAIAKAEQDLALP